MKFVNKISGIKGYVMLIKDTVFLNGEIKILFDSIVQRFMVLSRTNTSV